MTPGISPTNSGRCKAAGFAIPMVLVWLMLGAWLGQEALHQVWLNARLQTSAMAHAQVESLLHPAMAAARQDAMQRLIPNMPQWWERLHLSSHNGSFVTACIEGVCAQDRMPALATPWTQLPNDHALWSEPASVSSSRAARHSLWLSQRSNLQGELIDWQVWAWVMAQDEETGLLRVRMVELR